MLVVGPPLEEILDALLHNKLLAFAIAFTSTAMAFGVATNNPWVYVSQGLFLVYWCICLHFDEKARQIRKENWKELEAELIKREELRRAIWPDQYKEKDKE